MEKLDNLVKDLTRDINDMITRFWFQKERKQRKNEPMTDDQAKALADFVNFTKTLTKDVRSLPTRFQRVHGRTFEEKFNKELKQIETYVKKRLKEFDKALNGKDDTLKSSLSKSISSVLSRIGKSLRSRSLPNALNIDAADGSSEK